MNQRKSRLSSPLAGILAGTALALLLGAPSGAAPLPASPGLAGPPTAARGGVILVQDEAAPEGEQQPRKRKKREQQAEEQSEGEAKPRERRRREQQAEEQPAEGKGGGERRSRRERQQQAEEQSGEREAKPREQRRREQASQDDGGEKEQPRRRQGGRQGDESLMPDNTQQTNEQRSREERRAQQQAEKEAKQRERDERKAEEAKREEREKQRQQQAEDKQRRQDKQRKEDKQREQEQADQAQRERRQQQAQDEQRKQEQAEQENRERRRQQDDEAAPAEQNDQAARERPRRNDGEAEQPEDANRGETRPRREEDAELPPGEEPAAEAEQREGTEGSEGRRPRREQVDNGPPPADDRAAQEEVRPERVESVDAEQGTRRRESRDEDEPRDRERPRGTDVLREIGDRLILRTNGQVVVESSDRPRLGRNARDVYTEDLPNERTRETVVRDNGVRVVTIRNRYGDVIRRSRITPDGREYVLNYVDEEDTDRVRDWRDPGLDLPPFRPNVAEEDYILDAERAPSADDYYEFLEKPPVERVERLYSLDEVKRSSRVRQKTRRIDLDTITFDFGSASVPEAQITKLEGVASAMERLLKENPAETFLIEGHTDAVGSDEANLALSDRRAESVAEALTNVFAIPPENLATQGYGEQYLKVQTAEPERENRRVAIRRITPLVAPVSASAQ